MTLQERLKAIEVKVKGAKDVLGVSGDELLKRDIARRDSIDAALMLVELIKEMNTQPDADAEGIEETLPDECPNCGQEFDVLDMELLPNLTNDKTIDLNYECVCGQYMQFRYYNPELRITIPER